MQISIRVSPRSCMDKACVSRSGPPDSLNWPGLPLVATTARLPCRKIALQNEYLHIEDKR